MTRDRRAYGKVYREANKEKLLAYREARREEHRLYDKNRKSARLVLYYKNSYGLSEDQYKLLLSKGCAICGTLENLCVDHDHACCPGKTTCGKCVRGALCVTHNTALGRFDDNVEYLQRAIDYLTLDKSLQTC